MKKIFTLLTLLLCAVTSSWGTVVSFEFPNEYLSNTSGSLDGTGCSVSYSGIGNTSGNAHIEGSDPGTYYLKMTSNDAYVQITLSASGDKFQPGDVLTIDAWINSTSTTKGFYLKSSSGNKAASTGTSGVQSIFYTLVAADIESDGSIKLFRVDSGSYLHGVSVNHTASDGKTDLTGAWSPTSLTTCVGASATIPTFAVSAGTLGTDYSVTYTLVSGTSATVNSSSGITAINTTSPGSAVVKATINVINTTSYKATTSEYICSIIVRPNSWNFKTISSTDITNFTADDNWAYNSSNNYYYYNAATTQNEFNPFVANGESVETSFGLLFARNNGNGVKACFRFYSGKGIYVNNSQAFIKIPSLSAGDVISVSFVSGGDSSKDFLTSGSTNVTFMNGQSSSANSSTIAVANYTVDADGDVTFNLANGFYIRGIAINSILVEIGKYEWATFNNANKALNFTGTGVNAYAVTGRNDYAITKSDALTEVPANTPLLLNAPEGSYEIPVIATASSVGTNLLVAGDGSTISAVSGKTRYVLGVEGENAQFQKIVSTPATVPVGKAYLEFNEVIESRTLGFDDEVTAIKNIKVGTEDNVYYDLQGRRVLYPTKGLYIVNGKKVIMK